MVDKSGESNRRQNHTIIKPGGLLSARAQTPYHNYYHCKVWITCEWNKRDTTHQMLCKTFLSPFRISIIKK